MKFNFHYSLYQCFSGLNKLCRQNYKKRTAFYTVLNWLGWKDLNPRNGGVRVRCLTTWRHPNIRFCCYCRDNVDYYITTKP